MASDQATLRASDLLGRNIIDGSGRPRGHIVGIVADGHERGHLEVTAVLATAGPWGRLLGYERDEVRGPWIIEVVARRVLRRHVKRVPWPQVRFAED
ncbi:hypothetical protein [Micromonospora sp. WMMD980]|uniref:hypothetical protein n=1 Tax=Micromonospora sp. WMMD980 TaxID=3016088 RepID=UPI0024175DBD|nr:hypothetical protein [Micromonospora sp. WMMD980]MDG4800135.1 hypothetical protein [Micromonospora sp. WMMD980]